MRNVGYAEWGRTPQLDEGGANRGMGFAGERWHLPRVFQANRWEAVGRDARRGSKVMSSEIWVECAMVCDAVEDWWLTRE